MKQIVKALIKFYQIIFANKLATCRFVPSCSEYTYESIEKYGVIKGSFLGIRRILGCHPFSKKPFYDPV